MQATVEEGLTMHEMVIEQLRTTCRLVFGKRPTKGVDPCRIPFDDGARYEDGARFSVIPARKRHHLDIAACDGWVEIVYWPNRSGYTNDVAQFEMADPQFQKKVARHIRGKMKTFFPLAWDSEEE